MTEKYQLTFTHKYRKLENRIFTTVRWTDAVYRLGKAYDIVLIADNMFHTRYVKGKARIVKMEIALMKNLSEDFCQADGDCSKLEFFEKLKGWYSRKLEWREWDSEVQVLTCEKVVDEIPIVKEREVST